MKQYYELVEYEKTEPVLEGRYGVIYEGEDCIDSSWWNGLVFIDSVRQVKYWLKLRPVTGILMSKDNLEKECISFAEWIKENYNLVKGKYRHKGDFYKNDKLKTTADLYSLYKNNNNGK